MVNVICNKLHIVMKLKTIIAIFSFFILVYSGTITKNDKQFIKDFVDKLRCSRVILQNCWNKSWLLRFILLKIIIVLLLLLLGEVASFSKQLSSSHKLQILTTTQLENLSVEKVKDSSRSLIILDMQCIDFKNLVNGVSLKIYTGCLVNYGPNQRG